MDTQSGDTVTCSEDILNLFRDFYDSLYSSQSSDSAFELNAFLDNICLAWLESEHREALCQPISEEEMWAAILGLKNNNAPGSYGLPAEFYKVYIDLLVPRMAAVYEEAYENGTLPS